MQIVNAALGVVHAFLGDAQIVVKVAPFAAQSVDFAAHAIAFLVCRGCSEFAFAIAQILVHLAPTRLDGSNVAAGIAEFILSVADAAPIIIRSKKIVLEFGRAGAIECSPAAGEREPVWRLTELAQARGKAARICWAIGAEPFLRAALRPVAETIGAIVRRVIETQSTPVRSGALFRAHGLASREREGRHERQKPQKRMSHLADPLSQSWRRKPERHMNAQMNRCRLYLITPPRIETEAFASALQEALAGGDVACVQLRLKDATDAKILSIGETLRPIVQGAGAAFILNDRPDLAAKLDADGVHIGQSDATYAPARALLGPDKIVGVTCHNSRHLAMEAAEAGADYVAFGAFYPTNTKAPSHWAEFETLNIWSEISTTPCVAIGGITTDNAEPLIRAGADFLAVSAGVWNHAHGPRAAVIAFNALFDRFMA